MHRITAHGALPATPVAEQLGLVAPHGKTARTAAVVEESSSAVHSVRHCTWLTVCRRLTGCAASLQGLHPSNMFACAVDFLLRVKPTAMAALGGQYARLADPAPLKIGIHIRVGDQQLVRS